MNKIALIPSGISSLRPIALPIFLYYYSFNNLLFCIIIFGLSQITDLIDGYVARKLKVTSKAGAYFDAITDFIFITGIFAAFTFSGYYPAWIMALIVASFGQFIISSRYSQKLYDPLGKYIGSVLYIAIGLTLLLPTPIIFTIVEIGFPIFAVTSFISRSVSITLNYQQSFASRNQSSYQRAQHITKYCLAPFSLRCQIDQTRRVTRENSRFNRHRHNSWTR